MQKIKNKIRERDRKREKERIKQNYQYSVFFYNMLIGQAIKAKPSFILGQYQLRQLAFFFQIYFFKIALYFFHYNYYCYYYFNVKQVHSGYN